ASRPGSAADNLLENYILVDWGTSFLTRHARELPEQPTPTLRIGQGRIALDFILNCGGSAYLAEQMVQPYLDTGRLHRIEDAPVIERSAYALYNTQNEKSELIEQLLEEW
ncbi:MAG: LysR family transcriptional regulator, partial [Pseudomonadota bacterium]